MQETGIFKYRGMDMKKIYRTSAFRKWLLLSILTAMVLTGCGGEKAGETNTGGQAAEVETAEKEATQEAIGEEENSQEDSAQTVAENTATGEKTGIA